MSERILITQVERDTQANHAHLYARGHQWPDLRLFDLSDLIDVEIHPDDLEPGKPVSCRFWAHYTLSEKMNSAGNPYKDVIALEPITAPASTTSTDTSAIVTELRAIHAMLSSALTAQGFTFEATSALDPAPSSAAADPTNIPPPPPSDDVAAAIVNACTTDPDANPDTGEVTGPPVHLTYANGINVSDNPTETDAFRTYVMDQHSIPGSLEILRAWFAERDDPTESA